MAKIGFNDFNNYGGETNGSFFSLKNDGDTAVVRFMYDTMNDLEGFAVHEVEVDGKKRYVNCLRDYNEPVENCPFCEAKMKVVAKLFVPLYNIDEEEVQTWDRGKTFVTKLSELFAKFTPLVSTPFEIERNGEPGDKKTKYETYELPTDEVTLEDLPEPPKILGIVVLDKTYEEMVEFLETGTFPEVVNQEEETPARNPEKDRPVTKRNTKKQNSTTPATGSARRHTPPAGNTF